MLRSVVAVVHVRSPLCSAGPRGSSNWQGDGTKGVRPSDEETDTAEGGTERIDRQNGALEIEI